MSFCAGNPTSTHKPGAGDTRWYPRSALIGVWFAGCSKLYRTCPSPFTKSIRGFEQYRQLVNLSDPSGNLQILFAAAGAWFC